MFLDLQGVYSFAIGNSAHCDHYKYHKVEFF